MEVVVVTYVEHGGEVGKLSGTVYRDEKKLVRAIKKALTSQPVVWQDTDADSDAYEGKDTQPLTADEYISQGCIKFHTTEVV